MNAVSPSRYWSPEVVHSHLGSGAGDGEGRGWSLLGGERCREMLSRVLARVPAGDLARLFCNTAFVMPEGAAAYLSAKFLHGRHVVLLGEGLLDLTEDEQAEAILPRAAAALLDAPHPLEPVREGTDWSEIFDERLEGGVDLRALQEELRLCGDAATDLKIDVHFAQRRAEELARSWQEAWLEHVRQTT